MADGAQNSAHLIPASSKLSDNILGKETGITSGYIYIHIFHAYQAIENKIRRLSSSRFMLFTSWLFCNTCKCKKGAAPLKISFKKSGSFRSSLATIMVYLLVQGLHHLRQNTISGVRSK